MKRYKHVLSHYNMLTCDMGELIPVNATEVLPGDTFQGHSSIFMRLSPQLAPVMHPVSAEIFHFFCPNRILDPNWEGFITGGPDGLDNHTLPTITATVAKGDPLDYMGVPPGNNTVLAYPIRAMNKIYNEWFRDQDLQTERLEDDVTLPKSAWKDDYFTSARPWTQKGSAVTIPLGDTALVRANGLTGDKLLIQDQNDSARQMSVDGAQILQISTSQTGESMFADLSTATGIDVNELRTALGIQRYQENRARYGSRFTEYLRYLGIRASDQRLQRPEMLGGGRSMVMFSEVLQSYDGTNATTPAGPLGKMGGHGIAALRNRKYRRFFEEHGWIISMMTVRPNSVYTDGIPKHFLRKVKEDYWQKELEHIGQEEINSKEIWAQSTGTDWGYTDRYQSYRKQFNRVSADFRDTLNYHHLARQFSTEPVLNSDFVTCNPSKRIFAEQTEDALWCLVRNGQVARRLVTNRPTPRIY